MTGFSKGERPRILQVLEADLARQGSGNGLNHSLWLLKLYLSLKPEHSGY